MVPETAEIFTSQAAKRKDKTITVKKLTTTLVTRRKNHLSLSFFTELKTYHLSYIYLQTLRYRHC